MKRLCFVSCIFFALGGFLFLPRADQSQGFFSRYSSSAELSAQAPPVQITAGPTPSVRLGDECVAFPKTVEVPILVKNDYPADGLKVSIDYDEVLLGYAWYRVANTTWRVERVAPYGQSRITIVLKRNSKTAPADPEAEQLEVPALYAVFYLKDGLAPDDHPFRVRSQLSLGAEGVQGGLDSFFFTVAAGQDQYRPLRTHVEGGSVTIYYRDGLEMGGGSVTRTEQLFTLPLYLTYFKDGAGAGAGGAGVRIFTVGIDYDEVFLSLTGVRGVVPPLAADQHQIPTLRDGDGKRTFTLWLSQSAPETACHLHVADLELRYSGLVPPDDHLLVEPRLIFDTPGDGAAGPAPEAQDGEDAKNAGAGGSGPGTDPGVVHFLAPRFVRGNVDSSTVLGGKGSVNALANESDALLILKSIFLGQSVLPCEDAADVNDNGKIELSDAVLLLNHLFLGGPPPIAPYPSPGEDRGDDDDLGCEKPLPYFEPTPASLSR